MDKIYTVCTILITVAFLLMSLLMVDTAKARKTDVYECPPNNSIKYCYPGTVATGCELVTTTTLDVPREFCQ